MALAEELPQADREAMLLAEVAALGALRPEVLENFTDRWVADVENRLSEYFPRADAASGSAGTGGGEFPDLADT